MSINNKYIESVNRRLLYVVLGSVFSAALFHALIKNYTTMKELLILGGLFILPMIKYLVRRESQGFRFLLTLSMITYVFGLLLLQKGEFDNTFLFFLVIIITSVYFDSRLTIITGSIILLLILLGYYFLKEKLFPLFSVINIMTISFTFVVTTLVVLLQIQISKGYVKRNLELYQKGIHDHLTGAYNRAYFDKYLIDSFNMLEFIAKPLSIILIDVDNFKEVNDTYGHVVGDGILKAVVRECKTSCRKSDCVARYGGEEFVVVCRGTALLEAEQLAERIRKNIEEHVSCEGERVTISIGVASYRAVSSEGDVYRQVRDLIMEADRMLYKSKHYGKNKWTSIALDA